MGVLPAGNHCTYDLPAMLLAILKQRCTAVAPQSSEYGAGPIEYTSVDVAGPGASR